MPNDDLVQRTLHQTVTICQIIILKMYLNYESVLNINEAIIWSYRKREIFATIGLLLHRDNVSQNQPDTFNLQVNINFDTKKTTETGVVSENVVFP